MRWLALASLLSGCGSAAPAPASAPPAAGPSTGAGQTEAQAAPPPEAPAPCALPDPAAVLACDALPAPAPPGARAELEAAVAALDTRVGAGRRRAPEEPEAGRARLALAARTVLCAEGMEPVAGYHLGRALRDEGRLPEAASLFDAVVRLDPRTEVASFAAMLAVDARASSGRCPGALRDAAVEYASLLGCGTGAATDTCEALERAGCAAERAAAEALAREGDLAGGSRAFEQAAGRCPGDHGDEALYNAAVLAARAADRARADALLAELRRLYPQSPLGARGLDP